MLIWTDITAYQLQPLSNIIRVEDGKTLSGDRKGGGDGQKCKGTGSKMKEGMVKRSGEQSEGEKRGRI